MTSIILFFVFLASAHCYEEVMYQHFGVVEVGDYPFQLIDGGDCVQECYRRVECILSFMPTNGSCYMYYWTSQPITIVVTRTTREDGNKIAIKGLEYSSDDCPPFNPNVVYTTQLKWGDTYSWVPTVSGWRFEGCRNNWFKFSRTTGVTVCLNTLEVPAPQAALPSFCGSLKTTVAGIGSVTESVWARYDLIDLGATKVSDFLYTSGTVTCDAVRCYEETVSWSDSYTTGSEAVSSINFLEPQTTRANVNTTWCLAIGVLDGFEPKSLFATKCGSMAFGAVCGYEMFGSV